MPDVNHIDFCSIRLFSLENAGDSPHPQHDGGGGDDDDDNGFVDYHHLYHLGNHATCHSSGINISSKYPDQNDMF